GTHQDLTHDNGLVWTSSDADKADVTADGNVTPKALGAATITADKGGIPGASQVTVIDAVLNSVTITPDAPSAPKGLKLQLTAKGTFTDGERTLTDVRWTSDNDDIASVSATGEVTAKTVNTVTITATATVNGVDTSGMTLFTVSPAVVQAIHVAPQ